MLKASSLFMVNDNKHLEDHSAKVNSKIQNLPESETGRDEKIPVIQKFVGKKQNMVIESYGKGDDVEPCVKSLASLMIKHDVLLRTIIRTLRANYCEEIKPFCISVNGYCKEDQRLIADIFERELSGIVDSVETDMSAGIISGNLVLTNEARKFLTGDYMEIGVFEAIRDIVEELSVRLKFDYEIYRNVLIRSKDGASSNEFDIVISINDIFYAVEVKSGGRFKAWGHLAEVGRKYDIVPDRLLLVDSYLSEDQMGRIRKFCGYYVSDLSVDALKEKVTAMITADL